MAGLRPCWCHRMWQARRGPWPTPQSRILTMRVIIATLAGWVALSAVSVQAAPLPLAKATLAPQLGADSPIVPATQGCGYGYRRVRWQDQWGYWHWGRCVP